MKKAGSGRPLFNTLTINLLHLIKQYTTISRDKGKGLQRLQQTFLQKFQGKKASFFGQGLFSKWR